MSDHQEHQLKEHTVSSEQLIQGNFLQVWRDQVRLPNGHPASREYIKHPGAVVVVALLDEHTAIIEHQYRYPLHRAMIEFPAGKLEADERGAEGAGAVPGATAGVWRCATRALAEETGYRAAEWAYAGGMHNAIAYSDEIIHICFARGLSLGERQLDEGEFLTVATASFDELMADVLAARLTDAKTCTALLWWQQMRLGLWHPTWLDVGNLVSHHLSAQSSAHSAAMKVLDL